VAAASADFPYFSRPGGGYKDSTRGGISGIA
jgi:hypothetical protein